MDAGGGHAAAEAAFAESSRLGCSRTPVLFRSSEARADRAPNLEMKVVARATSAAPTYFPPLRLADEQGEMVLVDGGLVTNNPVTLAFFDALERTDGNHHDASPQNAAKLFALAEALAAEQHDEFERVAGALSK